ncbi:MAG: hypothetical protein D6681_20560 [Calditrichaeota bacterium]|nr:MAG: hypothetical protein D6681_20560 [Calditrichota bacterium]
MLTVLFYTSLHYIKAFLAIKHHLPPGRIDSHRGIQKELHRLKKQGHLPKKILTQYEQFKNHSELARYHYLENYSDFNDDEFVKFVRNSCYKKYILIREYVLQELQNTP